MAVDNIGLAKSILWEEAKGKLRALYAASGQHSPSEGRSPDWQEVEEFTERFIKEYESNAYHE